MDLDRQYHISAYKGGPLKNSRIRSHMLPHGSGWGRLR
jgi:hypothetical protein